MDGLFSRNSRMDSRCDVPQYYDNFDAIFRNMMRSSSLRRAIFDCRGADDVRNDAQQQSAKGNI